MLCVCVSLSPPNLPQIGDKRVDFEDLPEQWQQNDAGILEAIQLGFNMGQASPSATGLVSYINETQAEKIAALDQRIIDTLAASDADLKAATKLSTENVKKALATFEECSASGLGYEDGACTSQAWVVAEADTDCTDDNKGALRYASDDSGLELCKGKDGGWSGVAPPSLGKNAASAGKNCAALKTAGASNGNGLYVWTI